MFVILPFCCLLLLLIHGQGETTVETVTIPITTTGERDSINEKIKQIESDYDFIIDEEAARFLLNISRVESFQTLPFTYAAHKKWPYISQLTRLAYLLDRFFLMEVRDEFNKLLQQSADPPILPDPTAFQVSQLRRELIEFQDEKQIIRYFNFCDENRDLFVNWFEYLLCRGSFDRNGNESDPNEFDAIENSVRLDFDSRLNNPTDPMVLELIEKGLI
eukprot:gene4705-5041_t